MPRSRSTRSRPDCVGPPTGVSVEVDGGVITGVGVAPATVSTGVGVGVAPPTVSDGVSVGGTVGVSVGGTVGVSVGGTVGVSVGGTVGVSVAAGIR
jgi:hypothetical protein